MTETFLFVRLGEGEVYSCRQLYPQVVLRAGISYGNSVRPSVGPKKLRSHRDTGFSPYDSLEFLVSSEVIWCRWVEIPLERGHQTGVPP